MMAEAQAFKPNQTLPPGTPDVYLQAWEEIVAKFGLTTFRDGLWKALRKSQFFPDPLDIEEECISIRNAVNAGKALERIKAEEDAWRASGEDRTNVGELMRGVMAKAGKEAPPVKCKVIPTVEHTDCPHCGKVLPISSGVKRMTSQELRELADVMEQIENQSAANREANKIHAQKCIEDQLANLPAASVPSVDEEVA